MMYQITYIEFDFDLDDEVPISEEYGQALFDEVVGQIWEADEIGRAHV